jgi:hypothetical protein
MLKSIRSMRYVAPMIALTASACGATSQDAADDTTAAVVDSAGVQIVDNSAPRWQPEDAWVLSAAPVVDIGEEDGPPHYAFGNAHSPVRLSDGGIVVADMQTNMMHFYDATGRWLKSAGRSGEGPGEFEQLYRLRKIGGDSLMALNPASLTSIFTPNGDYVRRFDLAPVRGRSNLWWLGRLADGTLVGYSLEREGTVFGPAPDDAHEASIERPEKPQFYRDSLLYMLFTMEGQLIDSIAELPGQFLGENRVYAPNAAHAFFEDIFYHTPGDRIEIRAFRSLAAQHRATVADQEGRRPVMRLERIIRSVPPRDITLTDELKELYFAAERRRYAESRARNPRFYDEASLNRRLAETVFPPTIPAHANRMHADALGNLWLQEYVLDPDAGQRWIVFDTDGRWLGAVDTPPRFTVSEIGADYVLGVWRDSLDVQHVRMYRLDKDRRS